MTRRKFKNFSEMSMSVTLKPKKNNMYKVTGVGSKMKAHGGIKKGEKFHDSEIDGMHDSGIKVKYAKPKKIGEAAFKVKNCGCGEDPCKTYGSKEEQMKSMNEYNTGVKEKGSFKVTVGKAKPIPGNPDYKGPQNPKLKVKLNKTPGNMKNEAIQRRMDRKTIIATDPATGRKVIKIAPKREVDIGKGRMESVVNEISDTTKVNYINKANKAITDKEKLHLKVGLSNVKDKSLEKRRKGVVMAKSKLGEKFDPIGKSGRHDIHHTDTSDMNFHSSHASDVDHGSKGSDEAGDDQYHYKFKDHKIDVNDDHTDTKLSHVKQRVKASGVDPKHHDAVSKSIHKHITQESVMSDQMKINELKISSMQKYKRAAKSDIQTGENARHKGYPEKAIDKQQDKRYKGIDTANKRIAKKQVKMAKGIAFDKRYKGGNMTGASKAINKIKSGLADHPKVANALRTANEQLNQEGE